MRGAAGRSGNHPEGPAVDVTSPPNLQRILDLMSPLAACDIQPTIENYLAERNNNRRLVLWNTSTHTHTDTHEYTHNNPDTHLPIPTHSYTHSHTHIDTPKNTKTENYEALKIGSLSDSEAEL